MRVSFCVLVMKTCTKCGEEKALTEFGKHKLGKNELFAHDVASVLKWTLRSTETPL